MTECVVGIGIERPQVDEEIQLELPVPG